VPSRGFLRNETLKERKEKLMPMVEKKCVFDFFCGAKLILNFRPRQISSPVLVCPRQTGTWVHFEVRWCDCYVFEMSICVMLERSPNHVFF
jgi:hypothetical protein